MELTEADRAAISVLRTDYILHGGNRDEAAYRAGMAAMAERIAKLAEDDWWMDPRGESPAAACRALSPSLS